MTDQDLVTREEMEKDYQFDENQEFQEKLAQESVSIGVIGGADGPTEIFVTGG